MKNLGHCFDDGLKILKPYGLLIIVPKFLQLETGMLE